MRKSSVDKLDNAKLTTTSRASDVNMGIWNPGHDLLRLLVT